MGHTGALDGFPRGDVARIRLTFATHPPLTADARNGGFVVPTNTKWGLRGLDLFHARGHEIAKITAADFSRHYG